MSAIDRILYMLPSFATENVLLSMFLSFISGMISGMIFIMLFAYPRSNSETKKQMTIIENIPCGIFSGEKFNIFFNGLLFVTIMPKNGKVGESHNFEILEGESLTTKYMVKIPKDIRPGKSYLLKIE